MKDFLHSGRYRWIRKVRVSLSGVPGGLWAIRLNRILARKPSLRFPKLFEGIILDDLEQKETFWGRRTRFCSLERVARTLRGGCRPPPNPSATTIFLDFDHEHGTVCTVPCTWNRARDHRGVFFHAGPNPGSAHGSVCTVRFTRYRER